MFALNFEWPQNEMLLLNRQKNCTVRLGDIRDTYKENSVVWITVGKKRQPKKRIYMAMIDAVFTKQFHALSMNDLHNQNPDINTVEELREYFQDKYGKQIRPDDLVTVIHFSEMTT